MSINVLKKDKKLYSTELENSLKESITIENEYKNGKRKGYNNAKEMIRSILNDSI